MKFREYQTPKLSDHIFGNHNVELPAPMNSQLSIFLDLARNALTLGLSAAGNFRKIAIPDYICSEVPQSLTEAGYEVVYYPIQYDLSPNLEFISDLIHDGIDAILIVHYFGFPTDIQELTDLCRSFEIMLIEDCAHCFGTVSAGRPLGTYGTFSIFSFRKFLPTPDGAILLINDKSLFHNSRELEPQFISESNYPFRWVARSMLKSLNLENAGTSLKSLISHIYSNQNGKSVEPTTESKGQLKSPSNLTYRIGSRYDANSIINERRSNFMGLLESLDPIFSEYFVYTSLPEHGAPLFFPLRIPNAKVIAQNMANRGIETTPWPILPQEIVNSPSANTANKLSTEILGLPIHSQTSPVKIAACISEAIQNNA